MCGRKQTKDFEYQVWIIFDKFKAIRKKGYQTEKYVLSVDIYDFRFIQVLFK